jgi:hypothetical protein
MGVLEFDTPDDRERMVQRSPICFDGNIITVQRHEEADNRFIAEFYIYAEIGSIDFPLEHWEEPLACAVLAGVGNVCCIDPKCVHREDYTVMRAMVRLNHNREIPYKLLVRNHNGLASIAHVEPIQVWSETESILNWTHYHFSQFPVPAPPPYHPPFFQPDFSQPPNNAEYVTTILEWEVSTPHPPLRPVCTRVATPHPKLLPLLYLLSSLCRGMGWVEFL